MLLILIILFVILLVAGVPLAFTFCAASFGSAIFSGDINPILLIQKLFNSMDSFTYMAIPLFLLAGNIMNQTGITKRLVEFADSLVGQFYGGLAQTTALSGMLMAGISGSANADATAIGALLLPPLREAGYDDGFRVSLVSACAVLGPIIPPSILMIVYSGVSTISVGKLFMAGIIPGITLGLSYMVYSYFYAKKHDIKRTKFSGWKNVGKCFLSSLGGLIMPIIIIGGILLGVVTATEAGILAVIYGVIYGFITKLLDFKKLKKSIEEALVATVGSILVICFATLIGYIFTQANVPILIMNSLEAISTNKYVILVIISLLLVIMGLFIDANAIILMMVPVFAPLICSLGLDPVYFAMIILLSVATGGLTPPVGLVLYIVASIESVNISKVVKKIWVFVGLMVLMVILVIFIPQLVTWIPSAIG